MNLVSDLLGKIGSNQQAAQVMPEDSNILMPPVLIPSIEVGRPCRFFDGSTALGTSFSDSFAVSLYDERTNQIAATRVICLIASGLWHFKFKIHTRIGFALAAGNYGGMRLLSPSGAACGITTFAGSGAAKEQFDEWDFTVNMLAFPTLNVVQGDFYTMQHNFPSTAGAGNQIEVFFNLIGSRLL